MQTVFIEATNGPQNWGKFMIGRFTPEQWAQRSGVEPGQRLLSGRGWAEYHILVLDLQTGEGAVFRPGGSAMHDLMKHQIWVCPLFEPFLTWLYTQDLRELTALPAHIDLPDAPFAMSGYRRPGSAVTGEQLRQAREWVEKALAFRGAVPEARASLAIISSLLDEAEAR